VHKKILLVGTVSNVAKSIESELKIVQDAISVFSSYEIYLVESDSKDNTVNILKKIKSAQNNFNYLTLGEIRKKYPNRVERISRCRNHYVEFIRENYAEKQWDFIAVADLDGMNYKLSKQAILSCFKINEVWDGLMSNQRFGYYDLYALRSKGWVESDCFTELESAKEINPYIREKSRFDLVNFFCMFNHYDTLRNQVIYSRMKVIKKKSALIQIESGFGGFAIYKPWIFLLHNYSINQKVRIVSEHVSFHTSAKINNAKFFINPALINSNFNQYNLNKFKLIRFTRELKKFLTRREF
jgi:hypothetical protein